jgi:hypothetical protein
MIVLVLVVVVGGGLFAANKYLSSNPGGVAKARTPAPVRPKSDFGSRPTDFADPRTYNLRVVTKWEQEKLGTRPNMTLRSQK